MKSKSWILVALGVCLCVGCIILIVVWRKHSALAPSWVPYALPDWTNQTIIQVESLNENQIKQKLKENIVIVTFQDQSEKHVGNLLSSMKIKRSNVTIVVKLWSNHLGRIEANLEKSLEWLQSSYVDIYLPDTVPDQDDLIPTWKRLLRLQKAGKVRHPGLGNPTLKDVKLCGKQTGVLPHLVYLNLDDKGEVEKNLLEFCKAYGIVIMCAQGDNVFIHP